MSTELTRHEGGSLPDRMQYAKALASASLLPRAYQQNPGNVLLAMELGDALGIPPIQAINAVHVIEGRPSASADLIASLVRKAGHRLRVTGDDKTATAQIIRADDPDFTYEATWTIDRAKTAGLTGKGVWKQYPAAMLKARAITEVARAGASDALYGVIYTPEEVGATVDGSGSPVYAESVVHEIPRSGGARLADAVKAQTATPAQEVEPDPPATTVEPAEPAEWAEVDLHDQARKRMFAIFNEQGITDRDQQIAGISQVIGRPIESRSDLTTDEMNRVTTALKARAQNPGDQQ